MSIVRETGSGFRRPGLTLALLAFAQLIISIDYNIVYVALPEIGESLGFSAQTLQWVITAIALFVLVLLAYACWRFHEGRNPVPSRKRGCMRGRSWHCARKPAGPRIWALRSSRMRASSSRR